MPGRWDDAAGLRHRVLRQSVYPRQGRPALQFGPLPRLGRHLGPEQGPPDDAADDSGSRDRRGDSWGSFAGAGIKPAASDVQTVIIPGAGHWVAERAPEEMLTAPGTFLAGPVPGGRRVTPASLTADNEPAPGQGPVSAGPEWPTTSTPRHSDRQASATDRGPQNLCRPPTPAPAPHLTFERTT
jgi:hypothetical protein